MHYPNFSTAIDDVESKIVHRSLPVHTERWQSIDISKRPEAEMRELASVYFEVPLHTTVVAAYADIIHPNLPWADNHFELERVSGIPFNPGETWKEWPYGNSASNFRRDGVFSHTYAERYWPKRAHPLGNVDEPVTMLAGIRYPYGDLNDVVGLLVREPLTRQAYLPVWFPEDTGVVHEERVPCTLGYHFMMRHGRLSVFYPIRSCDFVRHFRDDLYLTIRLLLWVLQMCKSRDQSGVWENVIPGTFSFWAGSLHCFINDWRKLKKDRGD